MLFTEFSNNLDEIENILRYTLQLPKISSSDASACGSNFNKLIETAAEMTFDRCHPIIRDGHPSFFGDTASAYSNLSVLTGYHSFMGTRAWKNIFFQHSLLMAYIRLRELLCQNTTLTFYKAYQYSHMTDILALHGLDYLLEKKCLFLTNKADDSETFDYVFHSDKNKRLSSSYYDNRSSNFKKKLLTAQKIISDSSNVESWHIIQMKGIPCQYMELATLFTEMTHPKLIKYILQGYKPKKHGSFTLKNYEAHLDARNQIHQIISNKNNHFNGSDKLYLLYQLEKLFSLDTIDCLAQNIAQVQAQANYDLSGQGDINFLSSCLFLPNVLTRQYIIQMAFDCLTSEIPFNQNINLFDEYLQPDNSGMRFLPNAKNITHGTQYLKKWLTLYSRSMRYLSCFVFPVFEGYFLSCLIDMYKSIHPNDNSAELILKLYTSLSKYIDTSDFLHFHNNMEKKLREIFPKENLNIITPFPEARKNVSKDYAALYGKILLSANNTIKGRDPIFKTPGSPVPDDLLTLEKLNHFTNNSQKIVLGYYACSIAEPETPFKLSYVENYF